MEIHTRKVGDVHVLDISGKITLGEATKTIRYTISDLLANGGKKIVLNLMNVNYIDSSGIGELVMFCQGSSARLAPNLKDAPVDAVIIGIVDTVDVLGKQIYSARTQP